MNIPIIDISSLVNKSDNQFSKSDNQFSKSDNQYSKEVNKTETINQIKHACQNIGFFMIKNHGIPKDIIDNMWLSSSNFFDQDLSYKNQFFSEDQEKYPFGYMGIGYELLSASQNNNLKLTPDLKESFSISLSKVDKWPDEPNNLQESWTNYFNSMTNLTNLLLEAFAISLNKDKDFFKKYTNNHASALRALNYPIFSNNQIKKDRNQLRASPHTDYGTITILKADQPGLQVFSKDKEWITVPIIEDTFIVNIGDMMQRWTNDKWKSTLHQVININTDKVRRQSIAFFHNPNNDAIIESIIDDEEPKYLPIVSKQFLMQKHLLTLKK